MEMERIYTHTQNAFLFEELGVEKAQTSKKKLADWQLDSLWWWSWHVYFGVCVCVDMFIVMVREERLILPH